MRLSIRTTGMARAEVVELGANESVVVGRQPDVAKLPEASGTVHQVAVASPSVSANHALISRVEGGTRIVDLKSRNGSWVQLPPGVPVTLPPLDALGLLLAPSWSMRTPDDQPADAQWTLRDGYPDAVLKAVQEWLQRLEIPARLELVPRDQSGEDDPGRIALPFDVDLLAYSNDTMDPEWLEVLARIERYVTRQNAIFVAEDQMREAGLIVASAAMKKALRQVIDAAQRGARCLLLLGPSGSGKEGLARCFHDHTRRPGAFVSRNCAAFHFGKDLILSELFGADKGAFTGSTRPITGAVEAAHEGTLFLDEIGELPLDVQATLLRFLDRGEYARIGGKRPLNADVRVVGATNRDLRAACLAGTFRRDLWFRLSIQVVDVPPLSQRIDDVLAYLRTRRLDDDRSLLDVMSPEALDLLRQHRWEGNFRELINFADRLPRNPAAIDLATCRRALAEGSFHTMPETASPPPPTGQLDWMSLSQRAAAAFAEDHETPTPRTWDEVKDYVEGYLKPLLFASLSGADRLTRRDDVDLRAAADALKADRGTAGKQLDRYFDRFASDGR